MACLFISSSSVMEIAVLHSRLTNIYVQLYAVSFGLSTLKPSFFSVKLTIHHRHRWK
jgi:hypothetical protein